MTTPAAAASYLADHLSTWGARGYVVYNPHGVPLIDLMIIYGFNNGGSDHWYNGQLIAADGTGLGNHVCSHESYMLHDLGIVEGSREDRHECFREHFPDGYRMDFISLANVRDHPGLTEAYKLNQLKAAAAKAKEGSGMKVTLMSHTKDAAQLLAFTKRTRLELTPKAMEEVHELSHDELMAEMDYMAATVPSSWEFTEYVFLIEGVSRAFTHQLVRTRSGSYAQQAMRVVDMKQFEYVHTHRSAASPEARAIIEGVCDSIAIAYKALIEVGMLPEDARGVLPTNVSTNIMCKFDLRALTELLRSRCGGRTQDEYRDVANAMADAVIEAHPWAEKFLFAQGRDHYADIEAFAQREYGLDLTKKGELLKMVDRLRKNEGGRENG